MASLENQVSDVDVGEYVSKRLNTMFQKFGESIDRLIDSIVQEEVAAWSVEAVPYNNPSAAQGHLDDSDSEDTVVLRGYDKSPRKLKDLIMDTPSQTDQPSTASDSDHPARSLKRGKSTFELDKKNADGSLEKSSESSHKPRNGSKRIHRSSPY